MTSTFVSHHCWLSFQSVEDFINISFKNGYLTCHICYKCLLVKEGVQNQFCNSQTIFCYIFLDALVYPFSESIFFFNLCHILKYNYDVPFNVMAYILRWLSWKKPPFWNFDTPRTFTLPNLVLLSSNQQLCHCSARLSSYRLNKKIIKSTNLPHVHWPGYWTFSWPAIEVYTVLIYLSSY